MSDFDGLCPECGGAGDHEPPELQGVDARFPVTIPCRTCDGSGTLAAENAHVEGLEGRIKELESREGMPVDTLLGKLSKVEAEVARLEKVIEQWQSRWDEHCSQVMFDDVARLAAENARLQLDIGQTAMRYEERISLLTRECARITEDYLSYQLMHSKISRDHLAEVKDLLADVAKLQAENAALRKALTRVLNSAGVRQQLAPSVYDEARKLAGPQEA